jgi:1-deoxy-D-xylulose-5-phosphate reductoisomerase
VAGAPLKPVVVLGATGSIGTQALDVARQLEIPVVGLAASGASTALLELAETHPRARVAIAGPDASAARPGGRFEVGEDAVVDLAATPDVVVVNGIVGAAGLAPSIAALEAGNRLALANKESMVIGGALVERAAEAGGGEVIPVDSEHSAVWQCLQGEDRDRVRRIMLTASGGPFRGLRAEDLTEVTPEQALDHPTWKMGPRITVDSATLMNKAFEVIEAHFLFGFAFDEIEVIVHPQSFVHALVEFVDGVVKAEVGPPDMRKPLQYALTYPERAPAGRGPSLDLAGRDLTFERPDVAAFPCLDLGYRAGRQGGVAPTVLNAADEVAVEAFLAGTIRFPDIAGVVHDALDAVPDAAVERLGDVFAADAAGRDAARDAVTRVTNGRR